MTQRLYQNHNRSFLRYWNVLAFATFVVAISGISEQIYAQNPVARQGSSGRQERANATELIPFSELNAEAQHRIREVVSNPSFYRRLPITTIDADPDHFRFLIRNPEVVVSIWRLMGVTEMTAKRVGPYTIDTNDGAGTISNLELVYGNNNLHVFYGTGSYEGPVLRRKISGRCVMVVNSQATPKQGGGYDLTSQLDVFLKVDNATASLVTRTIQPIVGSTADHNFTESMQFIERLNQTTRDNGPGVKSMAGRLSLEKETLEGYEIVIDKVFERAYQAAIAATALPPRGETTPLISNSEQVALSSQPRPRTQPTYPYYEKPLGREPDQSQPAPNSESTSQFRPVLRTAPPSVEQSSVSPRGIAPMRSLGSFDDESNVAQSDEWVSPKEGFSVLEGGTRPSTLTRTSPTHEPVRERVAQGVRASFGSPASSTPTTFKFSDRR